MSPTLEFDRPFLAPNLDRGYSCLVESKEHVCVVCFFLTLESLTSPRPDLAPASTDGVVPDPLQNQSN